jgi:phosphoribosylformylglycinamidine synthase subunit PurS
VGVGVTFPVSVEIRGLEGLADPEGLAIERALPSLGFGAVHNVRVGRVIRFDIDAADARAARERAEELCARLLANPVTERAEVHVGAGPES